MPITLKPNKVSFKDANGDYFPQDVISDYDTADLDAAVAQMEADVQSGITQIEQKTAESIASIPADYTALSGDVSDLKSAIGYRDVETQVSIGICQYQTYWNVETNIAVRTSLSPTNWYSFNPYSVASGQKFRVKACQGNTVKTRIWVVTDDNLNIISMAQNHKGTEYATENVTIPNGGTKLLITTTSSVSGGVAPYAFLYSISSQASCVLCTPQTLNDDEKEQARLNINAASDKKLNGKKLSLLGDSISAYAGTIPSGNTAYYTGSNSGVTSPNQMWWKVLCDNTGMTPLIINGWSGSGVNWQTDANHANIVPMSDDSRCNRLHDGAITPDIILIAGGVNDYTYAEYAQNEPLAWDGKTAPTYTEPTTGKKVYNSFTEAYVAMIKKLQTNYPNAIVVALSTWFTMRGTDNGYVLTHTVGQNTYTQQEYNDKIRYVAEQMHIPYIDVSNIGFNRNNFYPTYAVDSSTIPTHPNATGQAIMGKAIAEKIVALVSGYLT